MASDDKIGAGPDAVPVEAVVFDVGGVLLDWDPRHLFRSLIPDEGELEYFLSAVCSPEWHAQQDLGAEICTACEELSAVHPRYRDEIRSWATRNEEMVAGVISGSPEILADLRFRGVPCYCLSNMEREAFERRRVRFRFLNDFDGWVVSAYEGVAKPDPRIFGRLIERFGLKAPRCVFIDDRLVNLAAAQALGFRTLHFVDAARLRSDLEGLGLLTT